MPVWYKLAEWGGLGQAETGESRESRIQNNSVQTSENAVTTHPARVLHEGCLTLSQLELKKRKQDLF